MVSTGFTRMDLLELDHCRIGHSLQDVDQIVHFGRSRLLKRLHCLLLLVAVHMCFVVRAYVGHHEDGKK